jgi:Abnormal spindle-like microcephaly-assoc'd, ASPM-SPD-2-Hydin
MAELGPPAAGLSILTGNGDGTFQADRFYPAGVDVASLAIGDFNGDHKPDVVLLDSGLGAITLLNTGVASFSPTTPLIFKKQNVGTTSAAQSVTVTNTGKTVLGLSSMKASNQFGVTSSCGKSVRAGAKCTISVTFSPTSQGTKSGTVTIKDSASSKPMVIELSGTGT